MGRLGLGLGLGGVRVLGAGLNFAGLPALPPPRYDAVTTAANTAATTLGVTAQSVVDALPTLASLLPGDGCLLASSGGAVTVQGDPVGAIRRWNGAELATQTNASLRPVSAAAGVFADGTKTLLAGDLSAWVAGESFVVSQLNGTTSVTSGFWAIGSVAQNDHVPFSDPSIPSADQLVFSGFGMSSTRRSSTLKVTPSNKKVVVNARQSGGQLVLQINGADYINVGGNTPGFSSNALFFRGNGSAAFFQGTWSALSLNSALYTPAQRAAVEAFCKAYYGVTYS